MALDVGLLYSFLQPFRQVYLAQLQHHEGLHLSDNPRAYLNVCLCPMPVMSMQA